MSIVKRPDLKSSWYFTSILKGMGLTFRNMIYNIFNKDEMPTVNYPEEKYEYSPRFKGSHILTVKQDGSIRCTACMLCATNCPADCISIEAAESDDPEVEKFPISYEIDTLRCVYCGFCEEACPVDAIRMGPEWQQPGTNGSSFVHDIAHLSRRPNLKGGVVSVVDEEERKDAGI